MCHLPGPLRSFPLDLLGQQQSGDNKYTCALTQHRALLVFDRSGFVHTKSYTAPLLATSGHYSCAQKQFPLHIWRPNILDDPWDTEDATGLVLLQGFERFSYPEGSGRLMMVTGTCVL